MVLWKDVEGHLPKTYKQRTKPMLRVTIQKYQQQMLLESARHGKLRHYISKGNAKKYEDSSNYYNALCIPGDII